MAGLRDLTLNCPTCVPAQVLQFQEPVLHEKRHPAFFARLAWQEAFECCSRRQALVAASHGLVHRHRPIFPAQCGLERAFCSGFLNFQALSPKLDWSSRQSRWVTFLAFPASAHWGSLGPWGLRRCVDWHPSQISRAVSKRLRRLGKGFGLAPGRL